jgi:hypothetical protein
MKHATRAILAGLLFIFIVSGAWMFFIQTALRAPDRPTCEQDWGYGCTRDGKACAPEWQCNGPADTRSKRCC